MDINKFAMLKATVRQLQTVSVPYVKAILSVEDEEAEEMIQKLIQAGAIEPFPFDGVNYRVR
jgi:hypothetical protein